MDKPTAPSCLRNQAPIFEYLQPYLSQPSRVLELGSGTGQHAVYIAERLPQVLWEPTEVERELYATQIWVEDSGLSNLKEPSVLDVNIALPQQASYDCVFTANTIHFVSETTGQNFVLRAAEALKAGGRFIVYGPFNDNGTFTSEGNIGLDDWLKSRDPESGIRDIQWLLEQAAQQSMALETIHQLPANNLMVVMRKSATD